MLAAQAGGGTRREIDEAHDNEGIYDGSSRVEV